MIDRFAAKPGVIELRVVGRIGRATIPAGDEAAAWSWLGAQPLVDQPAAA